MLVRVAEESFEKGLQALDQGKADHALAFFEAAVELDRKFGLNGSPQPRYLSQYGVCLGLLGSRRDEGVRFCREAVEREGYNPDLLWNLGRALLSVNRRGEAHASFIKGLRLQRNHRGIIQDLKKMGIRRKPPLPFLDRAHPVNVWLGRMRRD
jgi:tetratricopeptide (TPR) repeat protein